MTASRIFTPPVNVTTQECVELRIPRSSTTFGIYGGGGCTSRAQAIKNNLDPDKDADCPQIEVIWGGRSTFTTEITRFSETSTYLTVVNGKKASQCVSMW